MIQTMKNWIIKIKYNINDKRLFNIKKNLLKFQKKIKLLKFFL